MSEQLKIEFAAPRVVDGARLDIAAGTRVRLVDNDSRTSWTRPEVGKLATVLEPAEMWDRFENVRVLGYYWLQLDVPPYAGHPGRICQNSADDFEIIETEIR